MPRLPRKLANSGVYHVMTRTFPGMKLFHNDVDKEVMLKILRKLKIELDFEVYAYCLMDNHTHYIFKVNNSDISQIMKKFNLRYGAYLRGTGNHCGPVFRGRFNSKPVETERYLIELTKYIHRNPVDIKKYSKNPEKFRFSSLSMYLGIADDEFNICNVDYIMSIFSNTKYIARSKYYEEIFKFDKEKLKEVEFETDKSVYISGKSMLVKEMSIRDIEEYLCKKISIHKEKLRIKYLRGYRNYRAIYILLLMRYADKSSKEIATGLGNTSYSTISKLCKLGVDLVCEEKYYEEILVDFINDNKVDNRVVN